MSPVVIGHRLCPSICLWAPRPHTLSLSWALVPAAPSASIPSLLPLFWFNTYSSCRTQPRSPCRRKPDLIPIPSHILLPAKAELGAPLKPHRALNTSLTLNLFSCIMLVTLCVHLPSYSELLVSEFYASSFIYLCLFGT